MVETSVSELTADMPSSVTVVRISQDAQSTSDGSCSAITCSSAAITNGFSAADKAYILKEHNDFRKTMPAKYMPDLTWDNNLANEAQAWT
ncbi:hypothetical protein RRG08_062384 [Elysia crispata]|uniref:SCP domain-containing protein n=1 Tax=Elysia crispata TaxID=231223 RepID=A0AAE0YRA0_9GAST|nr:hypothetical protein RRG08_062384 [Elysia crispata]